MQGQKKQRQEIGTHDRVAAAKARRCTEASQKSFAFQTTCTYYTAQLHQNTSSHSFSTSPPFKKVSSLRIFTRFFPCIKRKKDSSKITDRPTSRKRNPSRRAPSGILDSRIRVEHHQSHLRECLVPARVCDSGFSQLAVSQRCSSSSVRLIMLERIPPMSREWESRCTHLQSGSLHFNKA